jgi:hypothetical protein
MNINAILSRLGTATIDDVYAAMVKRSLESNGQNNNASNQTEEKLLRKFAEAIARVFINLRKEKGYSSYEAFAFDHDLPRAQYWRVETGRHNLTLRTLMRLLIIHKLTLSEFIDLVSIELTHNKKP